MEIVSKIHAIMSKLGRYNAAKKLGITYPTLITRIENPGTIKLSDVDLINKVYNETFNQ